MFGRAQDAQGRRSRRAPSPEPSVDAAQGADGADLLDLVEETIEVLTARCLRYADEAAAREDYGDALAWLATVAYDALPATYRNRRREWLRARPDRAGR